MELLFRRKCTQSHQAFFVWKKNKQHMSLVRKIIVGLTILFGSLSAFSQANENNASETMADDGKGWIFGLNFGMYYPSKYTAAYYNGESYNENNAKYVMSNYYWYQEIYNALKAHDSIMIYGLPHNMHYKIAMQPGLFAQYGFNKSFALVLEFNYMKLKADDAIVFLVDPKPYATEPDLRLYKIRGLEKRVYADIGLKRSFQRSERLTYFVMGGININSTKVQKSSFYVEEHEYSMINQYGNQFYIPGGNNQTFNVYQGGIGYGVFGGVGATMRFGNSIYIEPGITAHWVKIKLTSYESMRPGGGAYLRFLF